MVSVPGKPARYLHPVSGISYRFDPATDTTDVDSPASTRLFKFILLADSPQIPQPHLLSADGNFHTGDLFEREPDGSYVFRGRDDDWIKSADADLIDTKFVIFDRVDFGILNEDRTFFFSSLRRAIEEKVYDLCGDLVKECIVVGHLRPSPALFIEAPDDASSTMSEDDLKESIIRRMEDFNSRQYVQERIADKRLIFVVDKGALPRTVRQFFFFFGYSVFNGEPSRFFFFTIR